MTDGVSGQMTDHNPMVRLTVHMNVNKSQALSLMAMFRTWNSLGGMGSSRWTAFFADGDGDFHPNCQMITEPFIRLTDEMFKFAPVKPKDKKDFTVSFSEHFAFDHDKIAWKLRDDYEKLHQITKSPDVEMMESTGVKA